MTDERVCVSAGADVRTRLDEWSRFYPVPPEAERLHEVIAMVRRHHGAAVHAQ